MSTEPPSLPSVGSVFADKLRIDVVLGRGAMGIVYGATDLTLGRRVALKVIAPEVLDDDQRRRFERESRTAAALRSEHAVRIYEAGSTPMPYLVMEYLEGTNLEQLLAERGPLSVADATAYVLEAIDAIAEAHRAGFVHRDLKPANLFLERSRGQPMVKVLDFGLARTAEPTGTALTVTGTTMGTPLYMAPEQVDAKPVDPRADVWSLGVTLYELMTGHTPFEAPTTMEVLSRIVRQPPTPIQQWRPDVPAAVVAIVERCLAKPPQDRFASAVELAAALGAVPGPRATSASHVIVVASPAPPPARRGPLLFVASAALTLLVGAAVAFGLSTHGRSVATTASPPSTPFASSVPSAPLSARAVPPPPVVSLVAPPFGSARPPTRVHHVHLERGAGFDDEAKFDAWARTMNAPFQRCAKQLLCFGVTLVLDADGTVNQILQGAARTTQDIPPDCSRPDTTGAGQCFAKAIRRSKPPMACGSDAGTCQGHLVVYVDD